MRLFFHTIACLGLSFGLFAQDSVKPKTWVGMSFGRTQQDISGLSHPAVHEQIIKLMYPDLNADEIALHQSTGGFNEIQIKWLHDPFIFKNSYLKAGIGYQWMSKRQVHPLYSHLYTADWSTRTFDISAHGVCMDIAFSRRIEVSQLLAFIYGAGINIGYLFNRELLYEQNDNPLYSAEGEAIPETRSVEIRESIQHKYFAEAGLQFQVLSGVQVELFARFGNAYEEIFQFSSTNFDDLKGVNIAIYRSIHRNGRSGNKGDSPVRSSMGISNQ